MSDLGIPDLGPFKIVQGAVAIVIVGSALIAWLKGSRKRGAGDTHDHGGVQFYFDGPLKDALDGIKGIYRHLAEMRGENERTVAEFRERHERELELLRDIRDGIGNGRPKRRR